jgi:hypothetical protein
MPYSAGTRLRCIDQESILYGREAIIAYYNIDDYEYAVRWVTPPSLTEQQRLSEEGYSDVEDELYYYFDGELDSLFEILGQTLHELYKKDLTPRVKTGFAQFQEKIA